MSDDALRKAAINYRNAVRDLSETDPISKLTYFEESPSKNSECLWRWQQLDRAGKALDAALSTPTTGEKRHD